MQNTDNIEKLFKDSFQNFEADVNPNVWSNVQSGISSSAGTVAWTAAKFALGKIIAGAVAVAGIAGSIWYFASNDNKNNSATPSAQNKTEIVSNVTPATILAEKKPEGTSSNTSFKKQTISSSKNSSDNAVTNSQQPQVVSDASPDNQGADNSSDNSATSEPAHKYGNASQDDGGLMRYNRIQNENAASSNDNSSSDENASSDESSSNPSDEPDTDQNRIPEAKPVSSIGNIPNIFTPNGDGENDVFFFEMKNITSIGVAILNKNGEMVAKWNTLDGNWNGKTFSGIDAREGVYFYSIQAIGTDGVEYSKKGIVTLER